MSGTTFWTRVVHGPIPWSKAREWCQHHGLDDENGALVWAVVQAMDAARQRREASERQLNGGQT